jgi:hypothetical protein
MDSRTQEYWWVLLDCPQPVDTLEPVLTPLVLIDVADMPLVRVG